MWVCDSCKYEEEKCYCSRGQFVEIDDNMPIKDRGIFIICNGDRLKSKKKKGF